jgi:Ca2+-binding RTX toxin-like protein
MFSSAKRPVLAVLLASFAIFAVPAQAGATVTQEVLGNKLTVKGGDEGDVITLTVSAGKVAVGGVATTLAAGADAEILVEAGGGEDHVEAIGLAAGAYKSLVVDGGEGNDTIAGGASDGDVINGEGGSDILIGAKGRDTITGGDGDDLIFWNNGDGSDKVDGGEGLDTISSFGAEVAEEYTYEATEAGAEDRVLLKRVETPGAPEFEIDLTAELLEIKGAGGNDKFRDVGTAPIAPLIALTVNGGDGDDLIEGGDGADTLLGEAGNDRLIGGEGADTVDGGADTDLMTWNGGDGDDVDDGGEGRDIVEANGDDAGESYTYAAAGGRTRLEVVADAAQSTILFRAEQLVVNGAGGADSFEQAGAEPLAGLTSIAIFAGAGSDVVKGSDGNDVLSGDLGDDRLLGEEGADRLIADVGDDTMVWNNGDGSDEDLGGPGEDTVEVSGNASGESFSYGPGLRSAWVRLERAADDQDQGAFSVEAIETEHLTVNGGDGDDRFEATAPGLASLTQLAVNAGNGDDSVAGGDGPDRLDGGDGSDLLDGRDGNDQLSARDRRADVVRGGAGDDSAQTDELTLDAVSEVEQIDATPAPSEPPPPTETPPTETPPPGPPPDKIALLPKLGRATLAKRGNKLVVKLPISCPAEESGGCRTTLSVRTARRVRVGSARRILALGSKLVALAAGAHAMIAIRLNGRAATAIQDGRLPVRIIVASADSAGNTARRTVSVTLRAA